MLRKLTSRPKLMLIVGLTMGLLVGVGMMIGTLVGVGHQQPPVVLHATGSHGGDTFAMATGPVDSDVEGLFMLDFLTGELHCRLLYPHRVGQYAQIGGFPAQARYNVIADLGVQAGKKPDYVLVTGGANFTRGTAAMTPGSCVVYVADANSGNFAAYGFMFNRTAYRSGATQECGFTLLGAGKIRGELRDP